MKYQRGEKRSCVLAVSIVLLLVSVIGSTSLTVGGNTSTERAPIHRNSSDKIMANDTWVNMNPSTKPVPRDNHGFVYDSRFDRFILVEGSMM